MEKQKFWTKWFVPLKNKRKKSNNKIFAFFQQLGSTFMLPISVLAVAGLFLGVGDALSGDSFYKMLNVNLNSSGVQTLQKIFSFIMLPGQAFWAILPLVFCMAIPIGFTNDNKGVAVLSSIIAFFAIQFSISWLLNVLPTDFKNSLVNIGTNKQILQADGTIQVVPQTTIKAMYGIKEAMDMSVLGSIVIGLGTSYIHNQFQYTKLPMIFTFFSGKRLVPILTLLICLNVGLIFCLVWPWLAKGLYWTGVGIHKTGIFGPGMYIFISRLLCPTGLHHMVNALFDYTAVGGSQIINGITYDGNINIAKAAIENHQMVSSAATMYLRGAYILPVLFGLPAAGIAMYMTSHKENKTYVRGVIISGIIATAFGGISETIEFLFLFTSPLLYLFHSFMVGVGYSIWAALDVRVAALSGDFFNFIIFGPLKGIETKWWVVFPSGIIVAAIYWLVFYFSIKKFDLQTIGRGDSSENKALNMIMNVGKTKSKKKSKKGQFAEDSIEFIQATKYLQMFGGAKNIQTLNHCFSRLRITLHKNIKITNNDVKANGAIGLNAISGTNIQIIIGPNVEHIQRAMEQIMKKK